MMNSPVFQRFAHRDEPTNWWTIEICEFSGTTPPRWYPSLWLPNRELTCSGFARGGYGGFIFGWRWHHNRSVPTMCGISLPWLLEKDLAGKVSDNDWEATPRHNNVRRSGLWLYPVFPGYCYDRGRPQKYRVFRFFRQRHALGQRGHQCGFFAACIAYITWQIENKR